MHDLFGAYRFLRICAQSHVTALCVLNYLFCVVPLSLCLKHADIRTVSYVNQRLLPVPGRQPVYPFGATASHIQAIHDRWLYNAKNWLKVKNMNTTLTDTLMKLLPVAISAGYAKVLVNDPTKEFSITLQYFFTMLGNDDPLEKEASRMAMSTKWDGFSFATLHARVEDGCAYAAFVDVALTNAQAIDTRVAVILHTGLYAATYKL